MIRDYDGKIVLADGSEYPGCRFGARTDREIGRASCRERV